MKLKNSCNYSFRDLTNAAKVQYSIFDFSKPRNEINDLVKQLCKNANWYFTDIESNGEIYTSFSPEKEKE